MFPTRFNAVLEYPEGFVVKPELDVQQPDLAEGSFQVLGTEGALMLGGGFDLLSETAVEDNRWIVESWPKRLEDAYYKDPKSAGDGTGGHPQAARIGWRPAVPRGRPRRHRRALRSLAGVDPHAQAVLGRRRAGHRAAACAHMVNLSAGPAARGGMGFLEGRHQSMIKPLVFCLRPLHSGWPPITL